MAQSQDPSQPFPPELARTVTAIGWAANAVGVICLYDAFREGMGAYQYHTVIPLLAIYKGILGIYFAARQGHQWSDPDAAPSRGGHYFVLAWLALYVFFNALEVSRLWSPPPVQPADLNNTLNWVLGFYVFGKASALLRLSGSRPLGLGKALDARVAARAAFAGPRKGEAAQGPLPAEKLKIMAALSLAVDVLGAICIFDVLREGLFPPDRSVIDIHFAYRAALFAYAGTNQWRKWTDPEADSPRSGGWWLAAWLAVALAIKGIERIDPGNIVVMPRHLVGTLLWVYACWGLGWTSDFIRAGGLRALGLGIDSDKLPEPTPAQPVPAPSLPGGTPPAPPPAQGGPPPAAGSQPQPPQAPGEGAGGSGHAFENREKVTAACAAARDFSRAEIMAATGLGTGEVRYWIEFFVRIGWAEKTSRGRFHWKGRGGDA